MERNIQNGTSHTTIKSFGGMMQSTSDLCHSMLQKQLAEKLPREYHKWLLLFNPQESENLPKHGPYDQEIQLQTPHDQVKVEPIYQLLREEE
jgi:hypothetical protein